MGDDRITSMVSFKDRLSALRRGTPDPQEGGHGYNGRRPLLVPLDPKRSKSDHININSAPLEFLHYNGMLAISKDYYDAARIRFESGFRFRSLVEGSQISGLKSQSFDSAGGGGGDGSRPVSDHKIDCILKLNGLHKDVPIRYFQTAEAVCFRDEWIWHDKTPKQQHKVLERVRKAMDYIAVHLGYITGDRFNSTWEPPHSS